MADRVALDISVIKTGKLTQTQVRIGNRDIHLINGRASVTATAGVTYWMSWYIEGSRGSSIALTIEDSEGEKRIEIEDAETEIPPRLGRNMGTATFVA
jgi:hypothetical protein